MIFDNVMNVCNPLQFYVTCNFYVTCYLKAKYNMYVFHEHSGVVYFVSGPPNAVALDFLFLLN